MFLVFNNTLKKILPAWMYKNLVGQWNSEGVKKYTANTSWMFLARIVGFITSFLTIAIVARYLGPENLGKLSYAQSFVAILSVFASLGMDQIIFRDLVAKPESTPKILGTAMLTKFLFGTFAFFGTLGIAFLLEHDPILIVLIGITALTFVINPFSIFLTLAQARVQAKYSSYITIFVALIIPVLKIIIVLTGKGIIYFAALLVLESVLIAIWSVYIYVKKFHFSLTQLQFDKIIFIQLIKDSWPFLFAGLFAYIYARIDQVMLQHFLGSQSVGLYDAAVKISNLLGILPGIIITSLFPAIVGAQSVNRAIYLNRFKNLLLLITIISLLLIIPVFFGASLIINLLYGMEFEGSVKILQIYIWSGFIGILGVMIQHYLIAENKGATHLRLTLIGAIVNTVLNFFIIPIYGVAGAATTTLISYSIVPFGILFYKQARSDIKLMFKNTNRQIK